MYSSVADFFCPILFIRLMHLVEYSFSSLKKYMCSIPLYKCINLFVHSTINEHLGSFQFLALMNKPAINVV